MKGRRSIFKSISMMLVLVLVVCSLGGCSKKNAEDRATTSTSSQSNVVSDKDSTEISESKVPLADSVEVKQEEAEESSAQNTTEATTEVATEVIEEATAEETAVDKETETEVEELEVENIAKTDVKAQLLFSGGNNESYEPTDISWLVNATDDMVLTLIYTCTDASHGGWGILGVGATVNDVWVEGPSYAADVENPTGMVYVTMTVGELKKALGITTSSQISAFKIGAWNGGKIISLHIGSKSAADSILEEIKDEAVAATVTIPESSATNNTTEQANQNTQKAPGLTGSYSQIFRSSGMKDYNLKSYASDYEVGDTVTVTVTVESDGEFSGSLGMTVGSNYTWKQNDYQKGAGTHTFSISGESTGEIVQLGIWYVGGSAVGVKSVSVKVDKKGASSSSGDYSGIYTIASPKNITINPSSYCSDYEEGDTISISVKLFSEEYYNGTVGMSDRDGNWKQAGTKECNGGTSTWSLTVSNSAGSAELQVWWMNGKKLAVKSISVSIVEKGKTEEESSEISTETESGDVEIPDESIPTESTPSESIPDESTPSESTPSESIPDESTPSEEESSGAETEPIYTFTEQTNYEFDLANYIPDLQVGDEVEITATMTGTTWYGGAVCGNTYDEGMTSVSWGQSGFQNDDAYKASATFTMIVPYESNNIVAVQLWWIGEGTIDLYLNVTKKERGDVDIPSPEAVPIS